MTIHVNTNDGIKSVKEVRVKTADFPEGRKVQSGWMCTSTDYDGVPDEFKKIFEAIGSHPAVSVEYVPISAAQTMGITTSSLGSNYIKAGIIKHPLNKNKYIYLRLSALGSGTVLAAFGTYDTVTKVATQHASFNIGFNTLENVKPFIYEYNGQYFLTFYTGLENASYGPDYEGSVGNTVPPSIDRLNQNGNGLWLYRAQYLAQLATGVFTSQTFEVGAYVLGDLFNGMYVFNIGQNNISFTGKKLFDPASSSFYLGPKDLPSDLSSGGNLTPSTRADKIYAIRTALVNVTSYKTAPNTSGIWGDFTFVRGTYFSDPGETLYESNASFTTGTARTDRLTYTPFNTGVTGDPLLWANTRFLAMPGHRSVNVPVGPSEMYLTKNKMFGILVSNVTQYLFESGVYSIDKGTAPASKPINRNGSASEAHVVYAGDRPYIVIIAYSRVKEQRSDLWSPAPNDTVAPRNNMERKTPNTCPSVITVTVYDLINAHKAYVSGEEASVDFKDVVCFHYAHYLYGNITDTAPTLINETKNNPAELFNKLRGFSSQVKITTTAHTAGGTTGTKNKIDLTIHGLSVNDNGVIKPVEINNSTANESVFYKNNDGGYWDAGTVVYPSFIDGGDYSKVMTIGGEFGSLRVQPYVGFEVTTLVMMNPLTIYDSAFMVVNDNGAVFGDSETVPAIGYKAYAAALLKSQDIPYSALDKSLVTVELYRDANDVVQVKAFGAEVDTDNLNYLSRPVIDMNDIVENNISANIPVPAVGDGIDVSGMSVATSDIQSNDPKFVNWIYSSDIRPENAIVENNQLPVTFALMAGNSISDQYAVIINVDLKKAFDVVS